MTTRFKSGSATKQTRHDSLGVVARLAAQDLPLDELFSRFAAVLSEAFESASIEIQIAGDAARVYRFGAPVDVDTGVSLSLPLRFHERTLGSFRIARKTRRPLSSDDVEFLETCALYLAIRLKNAELIVEKDHYEELAGVDALTGLLSRREFDVQYAAEWARASRHGDVLSVLMIDTDDFKKYNDRYGHVAGDACLQKIAATLDTCAVRPGDSVARYGGDEFAVILPQTDHAGAIAIAEKLRAAVGALRIGGGEEGAPVVTLSVGIATQRPAKSSAPKELVEKADGALYVAKLRGRNLVVGDGYQSNESQSVQPIIGSNLPTKLSEFFGRAAELDAIDCLSDQTRVLTLTGTAGIGKTRVAIQAALRNLSKYPDGAWFVDIARVTDAALVVGSVLYVLGDNEERGRQPLSTLVESIGEKRMLLIFDNCQILIEECAAVAEALLRKCPNVRVLATCRGQLNISGEIAYRIPSLAVHDAADLFVSRATAVAEGFAPTDDELQIVEQIVRRLDGIPMAIELAAARIKVMTVRELDDRLDARFPKQESATSIPRPHLLATLVDWSYGQLDDAEQHLLRRLAVFVGDWKTEAATEVCAENQAENAATLEVLTRLADKALLFSKQHGSGARYSMFETLHEYGRELLREAGELKELQRRHAFYYRKVAESLGKERTEPVTPEWIDLIETESHNFRAALEWSVLADGDLETGAALATALAPWWAATSHFREGRFWVDHIIWRATELNLSSDLNSQLLVAATMIGSRRPDIPTNGKRKPTDGRPVSQSSQVTAVH